MKFSFSVCTVLMAMFISVDSDAQHFAGGNGTAANPWQIETPTQLDSIRWFSGDHFILMNDIDLSFDTGNPEGRFWNDGYGWNAIGFLGQGLSINFNGNGNIIYGLFADHPGRNRHGLFGIIEDSEIFNLGLVNVDITGAEYVGAIVGEAIRTNIDRCFATGKLHGWRRYGGLVGRIFGQVNNSYTNVKVVGSSEYSGGLVGENAGHISNSYSVGYVETGLWVHSNSSGLVGERTSSNTIENSYWNPETSGKDEDSGGTPLLTRDMLKQNSFRNWDFSESGVWEIIEGSSYPFLKWQVEPDTFNFPMNVGISKIMADSKPTLIDLKWEEPSYGKPIGYNIYTYEKYNEHPVTENTYTVNTDSAGVYNFYYIRAIYIENGDTVESNFSDLSQLYSGFSYGDGTEDSPYGIGDVDQLQLMNISFRNHFELARDIDASETRDWNAGKGFEPINRTSFSFDGYLNGNGYKIDSLYINRPNQKYVGLFYRVGGRSELYNFGIINAEIVGGDKVGILSGDINAKATSIYTSGSVTGKNYVGGLVGDGTGMITNNYSFATVRGDSIVGGLVGEGDESMYFNYSTGSVDGLHFVGGIIGFTYSDNIGSNYWNIETSGIDSSAAGTPLTTSQMRQKSSFNGFDFVSVWDISDGFSFPFLQSNRQNPLPGFINPFTAGDGSKLNPYQIITNSDLNQIRFLLNDHFKLMNDLDLTFDTSDPAGQLWNNGKGWRPIGSISSGFRGTLDGHKHSITGLKINDASASFVGVFHTIEEEGVVQNILFDSLSVVGVNCSGGLASRNYGRIDKISISGNVSILGDAGGIVCNNESSGIINESVVHGLVKSRYLSAGSIAAYSNGEIVNSYSTAEVIGGTQFVGIPNTAGGLVSSLGKSTVQANVENSFHYGKVSSNGSAAGVINKNKNSVIKNTFWNTEISGITEGVLEGDTTGTIGLLTEQFRDQNSFTNWDFESIWVMLPNSDYPTLRWNPESFELPIPDSVVIIAPVQDDWFPIWEASFVWSSSEFASEYKVELSKDSSFQTMVLDEIIIAPDTVLNLAEGTLEADTEYFLRVKAVNESGESSWSVVHRFDGNGGLSNESENGLPSVFSLSQNYPNPFNPSTNIKFDLPEAALVTLSVYDMLGRKVATLINKRMQAGYHQVAFNASSLASGMYIYRIEASDFITTKKMVLIK